MEYEEKRNTGNLVLEPRLVVKEVRRGEVGPAMQRGVLLGQHPP